MMKKIQYIYRLILLCLPCLYLAGCVHEYPEGEGKHPLALVWTSKQPDDLKGIRLWIFDRNEVLIGEQQFADLEEARSARIALPAAPCTLVAATCPASHYTCEAVPGKTRLSELVITVNEPGSNPPHIQSGVVAVTSESKQVEIHMSRILSELEFRLTNMPAEVVKVRAEVLNSVDGFYLGINRLTDRNTTIHLGELAPDADGSVRFPLMRLMPVITNSRSRAEVVPTRMLVTLTTAQGEDVKFDVVAPTLESDEYYDPEAGYELFKEGTVVVATIKDWKPGNDEGEEGDVH